MEFRPDHASRPFSSWVEKNVEMFFFSIEDDWHHGFRFCWKSCWPCCAESRAWIRLWHSSQRLRCSGRAVQSKLYEKSLPLRLAVLQWWIKEKPFINFEACSMKKKSSNLSERLLTVSIQTVWLYKNISQKLPGYNQPRNPSSKPKNARLARHSQISFASVSATPTSASQNTFPTRQQSNYALFLWIQRKAVSASSWNGILMILIMLRRRFPIPSCLPGFLAWAACTDIRRCSSSKPSYLSTFQRFKPFESLHHWYPTDILYCLELEPKSRAGLRSGPMKQ